jgi:lysozyme family protein
MRELSTTTAFAIYRARYWNVVQGDALAAGVDLMMFDHAVNAGQPSAVMLLQHIVGVDADGALGPITLAATQARWPGGLIAELHAAQRVAYRAMRKFPLYGEVWLARLDRRRDAARALHDATLTHDGDGS